jgi:HEPN domain-containing protein
MEADARFSAEAGHDRLVVSVADQWIASYLKATFGVM